MILHTHHGVVCVSEHIWELTHLYPCQQNSVWGTPVKISTVPLKNFERSCLKNWATQCFLDIFQCFSLPLVSICLTLTCIRPQLFWRTCPTFSVPRHYPPLVQTSAKTFPSSRSLYSSESSSKNVQTLTHTSSCIWQQFLSSNNSFCPSLLPSNLFLPTTTTPL